MEGEGPKTMKDIRDEHQQKRRLVEQEAQEFLEKERGSRNRETKGSHRDYNTKQYSVKQERKTSYTSNRQEDKKKIRGGEEDKKEDKKEKSSREVDEEVKDLFQLLKSGDLEPEDYL